MSAAPGLAPQNIRQPGPLDPDEPDPASVIVELADDNGADVPDFDSKGNILKIEHGDGSVTVSLDGKPIEAANEESGPEGWFDNLVDRIDQMEISRISNDLLRGIDDDIDSRKEWIEDRANGIKLLGFKIEIPGLQGASDGAPVEGMSKIRHPLLAEAVLRFQANARSEMLPTDGPVKIRNDDNNAELKEDQEANALEADMNHYLTAVATEYYPDTDRMLLMFGFGGTAFKKVYNCPLRNRPVSETVDADDLIVNNAATDLQNAKRVTHRSMMRNSTVKRLQILGVYRDIELGQALEPKVDSVKLEKKSQQGVDPTTTNPEDRDREIFECYCELDIKGFEHKFKGKETGLEIPYRVSIDVSSKNIVSIVRNYDEDDKDLPVARQTFVKYTFVPGMGFYDIGLLHILGNTTNALTAAWREMLDNGMYANFPGFLMADTGARQNTNIFRVPPGGGALVKTGGMKINEAIMPLPYNTSGQAALQSLAGEMATTGMRIGGTSEAQVGEGRADAPVGTTLAMIEQATKILKSVHKRKHASQAEEFQLLVRCFQENPESFWKRKCKSKMKWDEPSFLRAIHNCELVPQADPNTSSHGQRVMKIMALKQLQAANPNMYDPIAIDTAALQAIGWSNPNQFFVPVAVMGKPPPELVKEEAETAAKTQDAASRAKVADAKAAETQAKIQGGAFKAEPEGPQPGDPGSGQVDTPADLMTAHAKLIDAETKRKSVGVDLHENLIEDKNRDQDRASKEKLGVLELARDVLLHPQGAGAAEKDTKTIEKDAGVKP